MNLFNPQQEMDLGDAVAEHVQCEFLVIDDEDVTGYLQRMGERLLARAPATGVKYRFLLFDQPFLNAFGMPGGRIYVSRKMVAFVRNEDELASVLGHELGHALLRELFALRFSIDAPDALPAQFTPDSQSIVFYTPALRVVERRRRDARDGQ